MSIRIKDIISNPKNVYFVKNIYTVENKINPFIAISKNIEPYINNTVTSNDYTVSLPVTMSNKKFYVFKVINRYDYRKLPKGIDTIIEESLSYDKYSTLYLFNRMINKKLINMENNKVIFIPVRYNDTMKDVGAIISQEKLSEYIIMSETFKNFEKKISFVDIMYSPLSESQLLDLPV